MITNDSEPKKRGVYLNADQIIALTDRVDELQKAGIKAGQSTILRALINLTSPDEMFALSVKLIAAEALSDRLSRTADAGKRPTLDATDAEWGKVQAVVDRLARKGMTATHNLVLRALVEAAPQGTALVAFLERFRAQVPNKPRGISKLRLEAKRKSHG